MRKLDIIVTHYNEPWEVGQKFFDMLALQRGVDFSEIGVTIVHDGSEPFLEGILRYPFEIRQQCIDHGGVSKARNEGMKLASAPWICFCDFDDMFASVYSLRHIMSILPADDFDILWCEFYAEDQKASGQIVLNKRSENSVFIHGKYFRRSFLEDHGLTFPEDLEFNEDSAFCAVAFAICDHKRVGKITAETPLYVWTFRNGSSTGTRGHRSRAMKGLYQRNKIVCDAYEKYVDKARYRTMVCRTCYDAYHMLNVKVLPDELKEVMADFREFWKTHKAAFVACDRKLRLEAADASRKERELGDKEEAERWGDTETVFDTNITFKQWITEEVGDLNG